MQFCSSPARLLQSAQRASHCSCPGVPSTGCRHLPFWVWHDGRSSCPLGCGDAAWPSSPFDCSYWSWQQSCSWGTCWKRPSDFEPWLLLWPILTVTSWAVTSWAVTSWAVTSWAVSLKRHLSRGSCWQAVVSLKRHLSRGSCWQALVSLKRNLSLGSSWQALGSPSHHHPGHCPPAFGLLSGSRCFWFGACLCLFLCLFLCPSLCFHVLPHRVLAHHGLVHVPWSCSPPPPPLPQFPARRPACCWGRQLQLGQCAMACPSGVAHYLYYVHH